jgi:hypothetical protein
MKEDTASRSGLRQLLREFAGSITRRDIGGALLLGSACGLMLHFFNEPKDGHIGGYILASSLAAVGCYLLSGRGHRTRVVFEFIGGFMDGKTLPGDPEREMQEGRIGRRFMAMSDYAKEILANQGGNIAALQAASRDPRFQCAHYEVIGRSEGTNEIRVRAKHVA